MTNWIPVGERLPEHGQAPITHWMPLPEAP